MTPKKKHPVNAKVTKTFKKISFVRRFPGRPAAQQRPQRRFCD
jgi:hypothetical protein